MITTEQIANYIENGLNELIDYEGVTFKIWATAGERDEPIRTGNSVQYFINGNLTVATSALTPNILVMGVNAFTLTFDVLINPPKTSISQTAEDLERVKEGKYWFLLYVESVISSYFQKPKEVSFTDSDGTYNATISAGVAIPEGIDLTSCRGNTVPVDVYIEVNVGQSVVMSQSATIEIDGEKVPYVSFIPERASVMDAAQYSSEENTTGIATSSALVAEVSIPINTLYGSSDSALDYFVGKGNNTVHFLKIGIGDETGVYLVEITRATVGLEGAKIASTTFRLSEVVVNTDLIEVPEGFQIGFFALQSSTVTSIAINVSADCLLYVAGKAYEAKAGTPVNVPLIPQDLPYDEENEEYRLYVITSSAVTVTAQGYSFEVENG